MSDLMAAVALVLVLEGALYALFPEGMKRIMAAGLSQPSSTLRSAGLGSAIVGIGLLWLVRG